MRVFVMFDLPVENKKQVRVYTRFRKELINDGFLMMQYSIYVKSVINQDSANSTVNRLRRILPQHGHIRTMIITEKQYEKMQILLGEENENIKILGDNRTISF